MKIAVNTKYINSMNCYVSLENYINKIVDIL